MPLKPPRKSVANVQLRKMPRSTTLPPERRENTGFDMSVVSVVKITTESGTPLAENETKLTQTAWFESTGWPPENTKFNTPRKAVFAPFAAIPKPT